MVEKISYANYETIRTVCGSPAVDYLFTNQVNTVMVDNLGSSAIYGNFNGATVVGSTAWYIPANEWRAWDVTISGVAIQGSGTTTPEIQVMGLY